METSAFLYENLSYSMLIWLHFGTSMLISYSLFLYIIPIIYNIVVLYLPSFNFGFKEKETALAGTGSGLPTIPASLVNTLNDSKVFAGIFSRNPKLFESIPMQEVKSFFSNLDDKISNIQDNLKGLPTSDDSEEKDDNAETDGNQVNSIETLANSDLSRSVAVAPDGTFESDGTEQNAGDNENDEKKVQKSGKKKLLIYGNLVFVVAIVIVNIYSFIYYNGIIDEYFVVKKGVIKFSENDYQLDYNKLKNVKDKEKVELIKNVSMYVDIINSVKADKRKRERALEAKEEGKK
jgi:hypothetical protein